MKQIKVKFTEELTKTKRDTNEKISTQEKLLAVFIESQKPIQERF